MDSMWRTSTQHLAQASAPAKIVRANRNGHGVRAVANSEMESVVTSHGSWRDGDGDGEFSEFFCSSPLQQQ